MEQKCLPNWWPQNPYPIEIFPTPEADARAAFVKAFPDINRRTAIAGALGRMWWNMASEMILAARPDNPEGG